MKQKKLYSYETCNIGGCNNATLLNSKFCSKHRFSVKRLISEVKDGYASLTKGFEVRRKQQPQAKPHTKARVKPVSKGKTTHEKVPVNPPSESVQTESSQLEERQLHAGGYTYLTGDKGAQVVEKATAALNEFNAKYPKILIPSENEINHASDGTVIRVVFQYYDTDELLKFKEELSKLYQRHGL